MQTINAKAEQLKAAVEPRFAVTVAGFDWTMILTLLAQALASCGKTKPADVRAAAAKPNRRQRRFRRQVIRHASWQEATSEADEQSIDAVEEGLVEFVKKQTDAELKTMMDEAAEHGA